MSARLPISTRITLLVAVVVLAATLGVALPFYFKSADYLSQEKIKSLSMQTHITVAELEAAIKTLREDVRFLATFPHIYEDDPQSKHLADHLSMLFADFMAAKPTYFQISYISTEGDGNEYVRVERDKAHGIYPVAESALLHRGGEASYRVALRLQRGEVYLSPIEASQTNSGTAEASVRELRAAAPVYGNDDIVQGVIVIHENFDALLNTLTSNVNNTGGGRILTNSHGDYIYSPTDNKVLVGSGRLQDDFPALAKMFEFGVEKEEAADFSGDGSAAIHFHKLFFDPLYPERFIGVAHVLPYQQILAGVVEARNTTLIISLGIVIIAAVIAYLFSHQLTKPLQQINRAIHAFAAGRRDVVLPVKRTDDIGGLARSLQEMVQEMDERAAALRDIQVRLGTVIDNVLDAVLTVDTNGNIDSANPAALEIFGYTADELIGKNMSILIPERLREYHAAYVSDYMAQGEVDVIAMDREVNGLCKDGREFPMSIAVNEVTLGGERMFIAVAHDITERKQTEQILIDAKNKAEQANMAKSQFLSVMSHELRTPMNGVLGMLSVLQETELDTEQREYVTTAFNSGHALLRQLNEILDLSKIEAGRMELEQIPFDLQDLLKEVITLFAGQAYEKSVEIASIIPADMPHMFIGDPIHLRQVFSNLLGNAIKFTHEGSVILSVNIEGSDENKTALCFEVRDTGIGIPKELQEAVFEPFTQADSTTTRQYGGTGLGLTIISQLIKLMGGEIGVESEPNVGSTFWFRLQLPHQAEVDPRLLPPQGLEGLRVLVATIYSFTRSELEETLLACGVDFNFVERDAVLEKLREAATAKQPYDLLFIESGFGDEDVYSLAQQLRDDPQLQSVERVIVAPLGSLTAKHIDEGLFHNQLAKPLFPAAFYSYMSRFSREQNIAN